MPNFFCKIQAVLGNILSGVVVATRIKSISLDCMFASLIAILAASYARSLVSSFSATICLFLIPVLVVIHSSVVSSVDSRSALVKTFLGR